MKHPSNRPLRPDEKFIRPIEWRREPCLCGDYVCRQYHISHGFDGRFSAADSAAITAIPIFMEALAEWEAVQEAMKRCEEGGNDGADVYDAQEHGKRLDLLMKNAAAIARKVED